MQLPLCDGCHSERPAAEVVAWEGERDRIAAIIDWRFTTEDARIRLKRLYPSHLSW
jgi:hypothetical protein